MNLDGKPVGRVQFLVPDLWPEADRAVFENPASLEALGDLVQRRTGVRPTIGMERVWAVVVPATEETLAMGDAEKAAFQGRFPDGDERAVQEAGPRRGGYARGTKVGGAMGPSSVTGCPPTPYAGG